MFSSQRKYGGFSLHKRDGSPFWRCSIISLHLDNELARVAAEICTLWVSLEERGKEKQLCAKVKYFKEH